MPRPHLVAALLAPLLLLTACGGDEPDPIVAPTPTASPTSAEPSPTESAEPEDPKDFIRRWVDLNTELQNTGETQAFLAVSSKSCRPCHDLAELVEGYYEAGGYVKTEGWTIKSIRALNPGETKLAGFFVNVQSAPTEVKKSASEPVDELPGGRFSFQFHLTLKEAGWLVTDYGVRAV